MDGCSRNGYCMQPNRCHCLPGFTGQDCAEGNSFFSLAVVLGLIIFSFKSLTTGLTSQVGMGILIDFETRNASLQSLELLGQLLKLRS